MTGSDPKAGLRRYLQAGREALLWKLDGLSEYDVRRPMVPTGTNLLGIVKHVAGVEAESLGDIRPAVRGAAAVVGRRRRPRRWHDRVWWESHRRRLERVAKEAGSA